jgi:histidinol-phosphate/aromatic aminotransferase/cobyric acid decarboxylase-like protein
MEWSKSRPRGAFDLAASGIRPVTTAELVGGDTRAADLFALSGPNDNGYAPLLEAIARFEQVETNRVACAAGTSGANALAMLALLRAGDEALIETPVYDPLLAVATFAGARVHRVERRHSLRFQLDPAEIEAAITSSTREPCTRSVARRDASGPLSSWTRCTARRASPMRPPVRPPRNSMVPSS